MPKFDGTGPYGAGPGTGRGMGYCFGPWGRGFGRGRGLGAGFGCWNCPFCMGFAPTVDKKSQKKYFEQYIEDLKAELKDAGDELNSLGQDK